jgi:hypothetical protein
VAYAKNTTWQDWPSTGTLVTAAKLNHLEDGVEDAAADADTANTALTALDARVDALEAGGGGGGGTTDHSLLTNRGLPDQHPQSAVTNLTTDLGTLTTGLATANTQIALKANLNQVPTLTGAGTQTISRGTQFTGTFSVPPNALTIGQTNGLQARLDEQKTLTQMPVGFSVVVVKAIAQNFGAVSHAAGSWPSARPHPTHHHTWVGDTDPGGIAAPHDLRFITP